MRADRLVSILLLLQNHGRMSARELAEKLEVSERTIHRDMEALSGAGIPVFAERGSNGGWALTEGYRTNLTGMKSDEILSLLLAHPTGVLTDLGMSGVFDIAYQKLLASFPAASRQDAETARQRIHVDGAGWHQSVERFPLLPVVQEAIWGDKKLHIRYMREESSVERIVEPLGLVAKSSIWYFVARVDGELRTYRISRLLSAQMLEETFERPEPFDLASYWETSTEQFKSKLPRYPAQIRLGMKDTKRIAQQRYVQLLHVQPPDENGMAIAEVEFHTLESACEIVLGYGGSVEVLVPHELRDKIVYEAQAIIRRYEADARGSE
ncbi:helix-turn-helix transcriptional regulator [Paenibacillus sp. MBLB4367]|uniref:helix-turn-helix transcriptional regulator n=1 Tax=Paenibacillus sp. MBLB4367 TaxID=3384767 RepID=UPI003907EE69